MERLVAGLTFEGFAQGGVKTSIFCPELQACFDAGALLPQMPKRIFISHGHPDHIGALQSYVARHTCERVETKLDIYCPAQIAHRVNNLLICGEWIYGSKGRKQWEIHSCTPGDEFEIDKPAGGMDREAKWLCKVVKTYHDETPSCGYAFERRNSRLKECYRGLPNEILREIKKVHEITEQFKEWALVVLGDTTTEALREDPIIQQARTLLHEVTFWNDEHDDSQAIRWGHTHIDSMIQAFHKFQGQHMVFVHRSLRHSRAFQLEMLDKYFLEETRSRIKLFDGASDIGE